MSVRLNLDAPNSKKESRILVYITKVSHIRQPLH